MTAAEAGGYDPRRRPDLKPAHERIALALLLLATFGVRAAGRDQPIVENYVGRQVPTAMVARNLDRGSGFLRPQLDTGPLPNLFLVEPPVYAAAAVGLKRLTALPLEASGRLASALATTLGAWGLFALARRREGATAALAAVGAFALFPVMIRYGRAFQPDALMLGALLAGLACWDRREAGGRSPWLVAGWTLVATGLAVKVISAYVLIPLMLVIVRPGRGATLSRVLALLTLLPALAWYAHAARLLSAATGSRASIDNASLWLEALRLDALARPSTYAISGRFLVVRAFTPLGFALGAVGLLRADRLWRVWALSAGGALAVLAGKLHHEYYWMALVPPAAAGLGRWAADLEVSGVRGRLGAAGLGLGFAGLCVALAASTWVTPPEWRGLREAAAEIPPGGGWLIAPEALIYAADRRGCRLEDGPRAAARAAGEWGKRLPDDGPLALIEVYREEGAADFADLFDAGHDPRPALHDAVRRSCTVLIDRPGFLLARVPRPPRENGAPHGH